MCRARVATTDSFFAFDSRRARREACGVSPYSLAGILRGRCAFGRRTVLRSKLRIANEAAAQRRCGHRTAVRAAPHANAGWIGRSKIRLSKELPARRRFRTPLRRNETAGAAGRGGERTSPCATRQTPRRGRPRPKIRGRLCRRGARRFVPDGNVFPLCAAFVRGRMRRETERALLPRKSRPAQ